MALDLGRLIKSVRGADLIVKPQYEIYLLRNPETFPVREDIAEKLKQLMTTPPRDRSASFSSSSAGACVRRQVFDYVGVSAGKDVAIEPQLARIFANGTWSHMRTQAALWEADIIHTIEMTLHWRRLRARGSIDGVGTVPETHSKMHWRGKEYPLEFKTANSHGFRAKVDAGPWAYRPQTARYCLMGGFDLASIVMENKDNQELHEWVIEPTDEELLEQQRELEVLNESVDRKVLPKMLPECTKQSGETFRRCPYGGKNGTCVRSGAWVSP